MNQWQASNLPFLLVSTAAAVRIIRVCMYLVNHDGHRWTAIPPCTQHNKQQLRKPNVTSQQQVEQQEHRQEQREEQQEQQCNQLTVIGEEIDDDGKQAIFGASHVTRRLV